MSEATFHLEWELSVEFLSHLLAKLLSELYLLGSRKRLRRSSQMTPLQRYPTISAMKVQRKGKLTQQMAILLERKFDGSLRLLNDGSDTASVCFVVD